MKLSRRAVFSLPAALLGCKASGKRTVRLASGSSFDTINQLPIIVARELGYFRDQGISVNIDVMTSSPLAMQALLGGSVDVITAPFELLLPLRAENRKIRSFLLMETVPLEVFVVSPAHNGRIQRLLDLKGAVIGVSSPGSPMHMEVNYMLKHAGVEAKEFSVVGLGSNSSRVAALEAGKVDAAVLPDPGATLLQRRHPDLVVLADTRTREGMREAFGFEAYPGGVLVASETWLGEHRDEARATAAAVLKAMRWITDTPAAQVTLRIPPQYRMADDNIYSECIQRFVPSMSPDGAMAPDLPRRVMDVLTTFDQKVAAANIDLAQAYTNEYLPSS
jgi:NitT/TauT family transport system substrate-binding protein